MNKFKYLISISIALLMTVFAGQAKAAELVPSFNNLEKDVEFLQGRNLTTKTNWTDPVQANANEEVEVAIYFHNAVPNSVAKNAIIKVQMPTNKGTQHVIKATLGADNATTVSGTIYNGHETGNPDLTINSNGSTEVQFVNGSVKWYPNKMSTDGEGANLPNGQTGDKLTSTGVNMGDLKGCFDYSGYLKFKVILKGEVVPLTEIAISKDVRKLPNDTKYIDKVSGNPGDQFEYKLTVRNLDGMVSAKNLRVKDVLPEGITYVGPTTIVTADGKTKQLPDGITEGGIVVSPELKAMETVEIHFKANSSSKIANEACLINNAFASSTTAKKEVEDSATVCFVVTQPTPTPTPTATPEVPTPTPTQTPAPVAPKLPSTGPEMNLLATLGFAGMGGTVARYYSLKRGLKKKSRNINVI